MDLLYIITRVIAALCRDFAGTAAFLSNGLFPLRLLHWCINNWEAVDFYRSTIRNCSYDHCIASCNRQ